ncbi:MAG TPA: PQQ-dependent dehydrogenase, methanol/ethanol family, partial [Longimicrobium sp.]|uniref:PQQ-dependent dehydrogenase, methanol/ethanol family n=1 Tax=Longimicrobium sp. TaxID=2029185 RepID=UPI002EDA937B
MRRSWFAAAALLAAAACAPNRPVYPVTRTAAPLPSWNEAIVGRAPAASGAVTGDRLVRARSEPRNWMTYYGAYDGQRYSTLDQVNTGNVARLRPAWQFQFAPVGLIATPGTYSFEAAPIVVDGTMFVSGWDGYLWALDATNGRVLWQYQHAIPLDVPLCCGNVNRGVAVAQGKVMMATQNAHLVALDASTGQKVWEQVFGDVRAGESATMAPLVVKNMVIVGGSGGEYGVRGHMDAFDIDTGRRLWRRYNVPRPGEPGAETWTGDTWERGGGTAWITGTYDPELDLVYWGTGNPGPVFDGRTRPGNNLYTSSVVAFDPDDGVTRWHYQWTPGDVWDYDGVNENILFDRDGRKLLAHFDRNGYLFVLDRTNGQLVRAQAFARATWGTIDARGAVTPQRMPTREGTEICPGPAGAKEWPHASYNPQTGLLYTPVIEACADFRLRPVEFREGLYYLGGEAEVKGEQWGAVKAIDPMTGREVWTWRGEHPMVASMLSTAGNLVFTGEPNGYFNAWNARTGEVLWRFQTGNGIHSNPVTYSVDGKQYIAVPTGWGGWLEG